MPCPLIGRVHITTCDGYVVNIHASISTIASIGQTTIGSYCNYIWSHGTTYGYNTLGDGNIIGWPRHSPLFNLTFWTKPLPCHKRCE
jgi:hypothetical protein